MYKVSVIIPMYKVEEYLPKCLDSVVNQTLKDIEVICVDDGSPDRSAEIAEEYVKTYSNFKLVRKKNGGVASARNAGLDAAQGEYIYFLDGDDYIDVNTLEEVCKRADSEQLDMVFFNAVPFFENEEIRLKNQSYIDYYSRKGSYPGVCTGQTMFANMRQNREFLGSACFEIFRKSLIDNNGIRFYEGIIHEDNLFTFQCVLLAKRVGYIDKAYYYRSLHDDSIMTKPKSIRNVEGYLVSYSEMLAFLHNIEIEPHAKDVVFEFMHTSFYRNASNIWNSLEPDEKEKALNHGGIGAELILHIIRSNSKIEMQAIRLRRENKKLKKQADALNSKPVRCITFVPRKISGFFKCAKKHGYGYAFRRIAWKFGNIITKIYKKIYGIFVKRHQKTGGKTPLVSFIMPVYNVEQFLEQGIDSLLEQSMRHIEIIAVDDGSTDRSLEILNQYAAKDSRVKVFIQKNQYAGAARNLGLANAAGEYVVFLDSDDFFSKDLAKKAYYTAKVNKADVVLFSSKRYDNTTHKYEDTKWMLKKQLLPEKVPFSYKDCSEHLFQISTPCPWTKMFRREFIVRSGLEFQKLHNTNDVFFTYSALAMAKRIVALNIPLVNYRVGLTSNLQSTKTRDPLCFYEALQALHDKLKELGVLDELRKSYVNAALSICIFNLQTMRDQESKKLVYKTLKNEGFDKLEVLGFDESYYYKKEDYYQAMIIANSDD